MQKSTAIFEQPTWLSNWRDSRIELLDSVFKGERQTITLLPEGAYSTISEILVRSAV
jgi:hypothetical protein